MEIDKAIPVWTEGKYENEFSVPSIMDSAVVDEVIEEEQQEYFFKEDRCEEEGGNDGPDGEHFVVYRDYHDDDIVADFAVGISSIVFEIPEEEQDGITEFTVHPDL